MAFVNGNVTDDPFKNFRKHEPSSPEGYIYYLKIEFNSKTYYKLGFTKHNNINKRFDSVKNDDAKYISDVLLFECFENAYEIEQSLHTRLHVIRCFQQADRNFPFFNNGQSEIYDFDVINLHYGKSAEEKNNELLQREKWGFIDSSTDEDEITFTENFSELLVKPFLEKKLSIALLLLVPMIVLFIIAVPLSEYTNYCLRNERKNKRKMLMSLDKNYFKNIEEARIIGSKLILASLKPITDP